MTPNTSIFAILIQMALLSSMITMATTFKHVVFMHGIFSSASSFDYFQSLIEKYHPGTPTTNIDMFDDLFSVERMWTQVDRVAQKVKPVLTDPNSEGTILICYSQGGLLCRGLLSVLDHNVETFIALSSPLAGQFGDTSYLRYFFPTLLRDDVYKVLYTKEGQAISLGNYWYDPYHRDLFQQTSEFLGLLNNDTALPNPEVALRRSRFLRLKSLVLVGGPDDGVITPWQSSHFGMYDANMTVQPLTNQSWFKSDSFGLSTLYSRGNVHIHTVPGIKHHNWHTNVTIFNNFIKPWLH